jgi:hypothetical protein
MPARRPERIRAYSGLLSDASRWDRLEHRAGDIFVCTPPKCGTTWMQAICALLVLQNPELEVNPAEISPWFDANFVPIDEAVAILDAQTHRRIIKTHTPLDGIPFYDECSYVAVYRDPRDLYFSMLNHAHNMKLDILRERFSGDPVEDFRDWIAREAVPGAGEEFALAAVVHHFTTFRAFEHLPNIQLRHYSDLKADLSGEMRSIATELGIELDPALLPRLVETASFQNMKKNAERFAPGADRDQWIDTGRFFNKGESGQWRDVLGDEDVAAFRKALESLLDTGEDVDWLLHGSQPA